MLAVHIGRSANCSSMGSIVDVLFVSSVVGTALLGAIAALVRERAAPAAGSGAEREREQEGEPASRDGEETR